MQRCSSINADAPACMPAADACCRSGWCGVNRGATLTPQLRQQLLATSQPELDSLCVGVGRVTAGRRQLFAQQAGLAVEMVQRVYDIPACNGAWA